MTAAKKDWNSLGRIFFYLAIYYYAQNYFVVFFLPYLLKVGISHAVPGGIYFQNVLQAISEAVGRITPWILLLSVAASLFIYIAFLYPKRIDFFKFTLANKPLRIADLVLCAMLGIGGNLLIAMIFQLIPIDRIFPWYSQLMTSVDSMSFTMQIITVGTLVPIFEELLFRGLVMRELSHIVKMKWVVIIQALMFGIYHINPIQVVYAAALGFVLGLAVVYTRSLWSSIMIHVFFNMTNITLSAAFPQGLDLGMELAILIGSLILFAGALIVFTLSHREERIFFDKLAPAAAQEPVTPTITDFATEGSPNSPNNEQS